jgi:uncharacterized protein (UPF0332 family)
MTEADYIPTIVFEESEISEQIKQAEEFIALIQSMLNTT